MQHLEAEMQPRVVQQQPVRQTLASHTLLFPSSLEKGLGAHTCWEPVPPAHHLLWEKSMQTELKCTSLLLLILICFWALPEGFLVPWAPAP